MNSPKSTVDNSVLWKLWHGINYFIGGFAFLLGSIVLFPKFSELCDASNISAWLYTVGSASFLLADITQWLHYTTIKCDYLTLSLNFLVSVFGSLLYLTGSICFIPKLNAVPAGESQFIIGSAFIVISQTWKIIRGLGQKGKTCRQCYEQDISGFYVDLFAGLGGLQYFIGTFILEKTQQNPDLMNLAAIIYSLGGLFFFLSALFMQKRYFCQSNASNKHDQHAFEISPRREL